MSKEIYQDNKGLYYVAYDDNHQPYKIYCDENGNKIEDNHIVEKKSLYQDDQGIYYVDYNEENAPYKIYCDENGNPITTTKPEVDEIVIEDSQKDIYQDDKGLYYVAYDEENTPYKVYCDEDGKDLKLDDLAKAEESIKPTEIVLKRSQYKADEAKQTISMPVPQENTQTLENPPVKKKNKGFLKVMISVVIIVFLSALSYFGYTFYQKHFVKPIVNMQEYQVKLVASGENEKGRASVEIKKIPSITNTTDKENEIKEILKKPTIKITPNEKLKNGDSVEVELVLREEIIKKYNLKVEGSYKEKLSVTGLTQVIKKEEKKSDTKEDDKNSTSSKRLAKNLESYKTTLDLVKNDTTLGKATHYTFYDVDNNGIDELITSRQSSDNKHIAAIYYLKNGVSTYIAQNYIDNTQRYWMAIYADGTIESVNWQSASGDGVAELIAIKSDNSDVSTIEKREINIANNPEFLEFKKGRTELGINFFNWQTF